MVNKVFIKALTLNFINGKIFCQLIKQCTNHFDMRKLFRTDIGQQAFEFAPGHGITLVKVAHGGAQLAVRTAGWIKEIKQQQSCTPRGKAFGVQLKKEL